MIVHYTSKSFSNSIRDFLARVRFWDDVYGFKMSCMKSDVIKEASVGLVKPETVVTPRATVLVRLDHVELHF